MSEKSTEMTTECNKKIVEICYSKTKIFLKLLIFIILIASIVWLVVRDMAIFILILSIFAIISLLFIKIPFGRFKNINISASPEFPDFVFLALLPCGAFVSWYWKKLLNNSPMVIITESGVTYNNNFVSWAEVIKIEAVNAVFFAKINLYLISRDQEDNVNQKNIFGRNKSYTREPISVSQTNLDQYNYNELENMLAKRVPKFSILVNNLTHNCDEIKVMLSKACYNFNAKANVDSMKVSS